MTSGITSATLASGVSSFARPRAMGEHLSPFTWLLSEILFALPQKITQKSKI